MTLLNQLRLLAVVVAGTLLGCEAVQAETVLGFARDASSQRFLYTEVHEFKRGSDGEVQTATTRYYDPQGREMARKRTVLRGRHFSRWGATCEVLRWQLQIIIVPLW